MVGFGYSHLVLLHAV